MTTQIGDIEQAGMLMDGVQIGYVDIGDDIGDASDVDWFGSVTNMNQLGGGRATVPNPHIGRARSTSKQIRYLISPCKQLKEPTFQMVLHAGVKVEDLLDTIAGKQLVIQQPVQSGFTTATIHRLDGQISDIAVSGSWGQRLMCDVKFTPTGDLTTTQGTVDT
jgi:hypothetical protein